MRTPPLSIPDHIAQPKADTLKGVEKTLWESYCQDQTQDHTTLSLKALKAYYDEPDGEDGSVHPIIVQELARHHDIDAMIKMGDILFHANLKDRGTSAIWWYAQALKPLTLNDIGANISKHTGLLLRICNAYANEGTIEGLEMAMTQAVAAANRGSMDGAYAAWSLSTREGMGAYRELGSRMLKVAALEGHEKAVKAYQSS